MPTLTASDNAAELGVNYVVTHAHLKALENGDVLAHVNFGKRIRHYRFNSLSRALKRVPSRVIDSIYLALAIVVKFGEVYGVQCFVKQ